MTIIAPKRRDIMVGKNGIATTIFMRYFEMLQIHLNNMENFMANPLVLVPPTAPTVTTVVSLHTARSKSVKISAFTVSNPGAGSPTCTIYIVPNGGTADVTNEIVPSFAAAANSSASVAVLVDHIVPKGSTIQASVSIADTITFRVSGFEYG